MSKAVQNKMAESLKQSMINGVLAKVQQKMNNTKTRQAIFSFLENKTTEKHNYNEPLQKAFRNFLSNQNSITNFNPQP